MCINTPANNRQRWRVYHVCVEVCVSVRVSNRNVPPSPMSLRRRQPAVDDVQGEADRSAPTGERLEHVLWSGLVARAGNATAAADVGVDFPECVAGQSPLYPILTGDLTQIKFYKAEKHVRRAVDKTVGIVKEGVIDGFMAANPDIKEILWGDGARGSFLARQLHDYLVKSGEVERAAPGEPGEGPKLTGALVKTKTLRSYEQRGTLGKVGKVALVVDKQGNKLAAKPSLEFGAGDGANDVRLRIFMNIVGAKLREYNPRYGWDAGMRGAIYFPSPRDPTNINEGAYVLVTKFMERSAFEYTKRAVTPRHWIAPQLLYLGIFPVDPGSVLEGPNFAVTDDPKNPAPVDLDALNRGGAGHAIIRFNRQSDLRLMLGLTFLQMDTNPIFVP